MKKKINELIKLAKENIGITILAGLVFIFLIFTFIYLFNSRNVSNIEVKEIDNKTKELVNYFDDIVSSKSKDIDKYIIFSLDYNYNVNSKNNMTVSEINNFLKEHFTLKVKDDEIRNLGITPEMVERNIVFDSNSDTYTLKIIPKEASTIAKEEVVYFKREKITKVNKRKYKIKYTKYMIEDPYAILNYYLDSNLQNEGKEDKKGNVKYELFDVTPIRNYLTGSAKIGSLLNSIKPEDVSKFAKKVDTIKVTYVVEDDKILIDKIK